MNAFDDFLGLEARDLSRERLVVFAGTSGSGKSTAIRYLLENHPRFRGRSVLVLEGPPWVRPFEEPIDVVVIDELSAVDDLRVVSEVLRKSATAIVASHVAPWLVRAIVPARRTAVFVTDRNEAKIERALERRGIGSSREAIRLFVNRYGATYTDLDIVLERCPADRFDLSLSRFVKFCSIDRSGKA